ncbi:MAG TPA: oligosaccharide flippase family protein [Solirubrobacterales bacterium]|nr:oligosaccharide flippase family protein [Solirubrobacterales bacterium]
MSTEPTPGIPQPAATGSIGRGSLLLFGAQLIGNAGYFVAVLILARSLGPSGRGTLAFITVTGLVVARVMKVGISQATTVLAAQRPEQRAKLLSNLLTYSIAGSFAGAALVCGVLLAAPGIRPGDIGPTELGILLGGTVATSLSDESFLLGCRRMRELSSRKAMVGWTYALVVAATLLLFGLSVPTAAAAWAVSQFLIGLSFQGGPLIRLGFVRPSLELLREMLRFGTRAWVGTLSTLLNSRFDQILMAFIATQAALGIYAVAVNTSEPLLYLSSAIAQAMLPAISSEDRAMAHWRVMRILRAATLIGVAAMAAAAAVGPWLIPIVFGDAFQPSVAPFLWLLPGVIGYSAMIVTNSALLAVGSPGRSSVGPLVCLVVGVALDLALIPSFAASGAAAAATGAFMAGGVTGLLLYRGHVRFAWRELIPRPKDARETWSFATGLVRRLRAA